MDQEVISLHRMISDPFEARTDPLLQPAQVIMFVPERFFRLAPSLADSVGQLDHLVNGLLPIQPHDVVIEELANALPALARTSWKHLHKHGQHDLRPTLPNQGQRTVEIKKDMTDPRSRSEALSELDYATKGQFR